MIQLNKSKQIKYDVIDPKEGIWVTDYMIGYMGHVSVVRLKYMVLYYYFFYNFFSPLSPFSCVLRRAKEKRTVDRSKLSDGASTIDPPSAFSSSSSERKYRNSPPIETHHRSNPTTDRNPPRTILRLLRLLSLLSFRSSVFSRLLLR